MSLGLTSRRFHLDYSFQYEVVPGEGVFLLSEERQILLRGDAYERLIPLLDGRKTVDEIVADLAGRVSPAEAYYAMELLRRAKYINDAPDALPAEQQRFWQALQIDSGVAAERLREHAVSIIPIGDVDTALFRSLLRDSGVQVADDAERRVVLTDDYLDGELKDLNLKALARGCPWLMVKPVGTEIWLGPLFVPGESGCWACLAHRLRGHRQVEVYLQRKTGAHRPVSSPLSGLPVDSHVALGLAATQIARWIVCGRNPTLESCIVTLDTVHLGQRRHVMIKRPQCSHCGDPRCVSVRQEVPLVLQKRKILFMADGGHRVCSPEETFQRLEHHISPVTGLVGTLQANSTSDDGAKLAPSFVANHISGPPDPSAWFIQDGPKLAAGGKGMGPSQAKASALGEAIERYSGQFQGDEARTRGSYRDLVPDAIHPNRCMLFSERQFSEREHWNAARIASMWVPECFDEAAEIDWTPVWSLTWNRMRYLPTAYCFYGYESADGRQFARADSNGCASGNCKEEAVLQGFLELVERDSVALWWYNRLRKPAVELASFHEPYFDELQAYYRTLNRDLWVLDVTSDVEIPACAAISRRFDQQREDILLGFGAHLDARIAVLRALTEINQSLPATSGVSRDDPETYRAHNNLAITWWRTATIKNQPYLVPDPDLPPKPRGAYPDLASDDLCAEIIRCVQFLYARNLETLVLDQTRPDTGVEAVKVIVPGLRHFWPRFGPGRLYETPVEKGWVMQPTKEDELNARSIYF